VQDQELTVNAGAWYMGDAVDLTRFAIYAVPRAGVELKDVERATEKVIVALQDGIDPGELARTKTRLVADAVYARDSQATLARIYGSTLAVGGTLKDVQDWPELIDSVTAAQVMAAARERLSPRAAVTGYLLKGEAA
jgi:zinc protease